MLEIEEKILAWRTKMMAALPANPQLVDEFEDHLRESITALSSKGVPVVDAFSQAISSDGRSTHNCFPVSPHQNQKGPYDESISNNRYGNYRPISAPNEPAV